VLRGERRLRLRRDPERQRGTARGRAARAETTMDAEANALWERLRTCRRELAQSQCVPPYVIFGDATLREMVTYRPRDADELSRISGVGVVKLERYGADFLRVLAEHAGDYGRPADLPRLPEAPIRAAPVPQARTWDAGLTGTVRETLELFRSGVPVETIAERRGLKDTTVYTHLARCIEEGELGFREVANLSDDEIGAIRYVFDQLDPDASMALKPVFDAFQGKYDYGLLRCVRAGLGRP
jgi:ATP-dependent DNA helicase RecQ